MITERWDPWREAAVAADGHIKLLTRTASTKVSLEATVRGVAITGEGVTSPYSGATDWTLLQAEAPGTAHLRMKIAPGEPGERRLSWRLRNTFVGDRRFDNLFVVLANDPLLAASWLAPELRDLMRKAKQYSFTLSSGRVAARRDGFEPDHVMLTHAMNAVAALAGRGRVLRRDWAHAAAQLGGDVDVPPIDAPLDAAWKFTVSHNRALIDVLPHHAAIGRRRRHKRTYTYLMCERVAHTADVYVICSDAHTRTAHPRVWRARNVLDDADQLAGYLVECQSVDHMTARIDAQLSQMLADSETALVRADPQAVHVYLPGMVTDVVKLRSAIALTSRLAVELEAGGAVGPYR